MTLNLRVVLTLFVCAGAALPSAASASGATPLPPLNGVLYLDKTAVPGEVRLQWGGSAELFEIGRSSDPATVSALANVLATTGATEWFDTPPDGPVTYYHVSPPCGNGRLEPGELCDDGNSVGGDGCSATCVGIVSDDFGPDSHTDWTFVDPLGGGSFAFSGIGTADARLTLHVPGGVAHDAWVVNNAVRYMQGADDADLEIEVKLESPVSTATQMQGIFVEDDADTWVRFDVVTNGSQWKLFSATMNEGTPQTRVNAFKSGPASPVPLYLRLRRAGATWSCSWTTDPAAGWTAAGAFTFGMTVRAVGVFAGNAGANPPPLNAVFDYFFDTAAPVDPEDRISCGDGVLDAWEQCDDGNTIDGDGCQGDCLDPFCGDGIVDPGEDCDDGNTVGGDGCSAACVGLVSDDFSPAPGPGWTFVNPLGDATLTASGAGTADAGIVLHVPGGVIHDAWTVNRAARLMHRAENSNFEVETKLESSLALATQMQGIFVEEDADTWIRFDVVVNGPQWRVFAATRDGGTPLQRVNLPLGPVGSPVPLYLRVKRAGNRWTLSHSLDGAVWNAAPHFDFSLVVTGVGLFAGNAAAAPELSARFDYFFETSRPVVPEDPISCGDGVMDPWEQCDDGNTVDGDGCQANCRNPACGDGITDPGEECDDGNNVTGDGCSAVCRIEPFCGDGRVDLGEQCDLGAANSDEPDATCRTNCRRAGCGDGIVDTGEECDDGNTVNGDGCQANCRDPICGDSIVDAGEDCDDGNLLNFDGCRTDCTVEVCGDALIGPGEECDDGNISDGDGCSASCSVESALCGNGSLDAGEDCDDGGNVAGDGCSGSCRSLVSDDFDPGLNEGWTFFDPLDDAEFTLTGAGTADALLTIAVPAGTRHDPYRYNGAPRLMQIVDDSNFTIEVKLQTVLNQSAQQQGVLVEQDAGTWVRFDAFSDGASWHVFSATMLNHVATNRINVQVATTASPSPLYLQVARQGNQWTLSYSTDPTAAGWTQAGSPFQFALNVRSAGIFAGNALAAPALNARFDYFFNAASPIDPEDTP